MRSIKSLLVKSLVVCGLLGMTGALEGCDSNSNQTEFLKSAPPGTPTDHPGESFSERRSRLQSKKPADAKGKTPASGTKPAGATTKGS
jgi:hypothetical protein